MMDFMDAIIAIGYAKNHGGGGGGEPAYPSEDGNYKLHLTISSGLPTLSWVSES